MQVKIMKLEILKERTTPLLSRRRVTALVSFEGATPSRNDLKKAVAKKVDSTENLVIIKHVYPRFGNPEAKIIAHVYGSEEEKRNVEKEYILKKHVAKEAPKEKAPASPAEEAPKEEVSSEKKPVDKAKEEASSEEKKKEAPAGEPKVEGPKEASAEEKKEASAGEKPAE